MARIAIIGSGQVGLLTAHGLRAAGHEVTVFSDRTPEQWLTESKPTGTAGRFDMSLELERSLGLNHWESDSVRVMGAHITLCAAPRNRLLTVTGRLARAGFAIDVRLQSHRWMLDLEARGGRVVVESVTVERLDAIAADHDLTIVAVGKADLARLFPRDAERSVYDAPRRELALVSFRTSRKGARGVPFVPVKFNILDGAGEVFLMPWYHKDHGAAVWAVLVEAVPGGSLDRFRDAATQAEVFDRMHGLFRDLFPWDADWFEGVEPADPNGWLVGRITPTVRAPVGRLPSGRAVTGVGDTLMTLDPIGGQGANSGNKMALNLVRSVAARPEGPFDAAWMTETFERYYERHGRHIYRFNNTFLEPPTSAAKTLLMSQYGTNGVRDDARQRLADAFTANFNDPAELTDTLADLGRTRELITRVMGRPWYLAMARGALGVGLQQLRQRIGLAPHHPEAE